MEILSGRLEGDHRSQWPNALSILDVLVEDLAGEAVARIGQDGAVTQGTWSRFSGSLIDTYDMMFF